MKWRIVLGFIVSWLALGVQAGTISSSVTTLPSFGNVYVFHSSTSLFSVVNATALTAPLEIIAPDGFEVSLTYKFGYSGKVTITPVSGTVSNRMLYMRFSPSIVGSASGNISLNSVGSPSVTIAVSGNAVAWAIPTNYYNTVTTQRGAALKTVLYNRILGHTTVSYTPGVWNAYATTDVQPNGKIWDIYGTRMDTASPYTYTLSTNQCGNYSVEGDCYNREHSFPQSWFNNASPMVSDVHHIFASDGKVNGMRNNFPFGNVTNATYTPAYGGKLGTGSNFGYSGTVFEQIDEYKGDFARAYFYMATRYENVIAGWNTLGNANDVLDSTSYPVYDAWFLNVLLSWHHLDPVSDKEIKRNNAIFAIQNNRNPYVDSPQFVTKIWGGGLPAKPTISASGASITNLSNTSVKLAWTSGNGARRIVLVKAGSPINALPIDTVAYGANTNITLAPQTGAGNVVVYNGTGSSVTITNMQAGVNYYYAIIEYNGWYNTTNYFTSGATLLNAVTLPVTWLNFTGKRHETNEVKLTWQTASERNNRGFFVERSVDGITFDEIGFVSGKGTTNLVSAYQYTDEVAPKEAKLFYRLKQTDLDGRFEYSVLVTVGADEHVALPTFYPNPVADEVNVAVHESIGTLFSYMITDHTGKLIKQHHENSQDDAQRIVIPTRDLCAGVYLLQIQFNNRIYHHKLIKN
jgi:endonuclease I